MDRTGWIVVIACILGMLGYGYYYSEQQKKYRPPQPAPAAAAPDASSGDNTSTPESPDAGAPAPAADLVQPETKLLSNEIVDFTITNVGGGVETAVIKDELAAKEEKDKFVTLNEYGKHPVGALCPEPKTFESTTYEFVSSNANEVVLQGVTDTSLGVTKRYSLSDKDPHLLNLEITLRNESSVRIPATTYYLYAGASAPLHADEWTAGQQIFFWHEGGNFKFKDVNTFSGGWFGMKKPKSIVEIPVRNFTWGGVSSQFFTTILKPETPSPSTVWASRFPLRLVGDEAKSDKKKLHALETAVGLPELTLAPGDQQTFRYEIYLGPKEYRKLKALGDDRADVMNYDGVPLFGWVFGWAIKPLAGFLMTIMVWLESIVGQFGLAIIIMTVCVRGAIWPLYAKSTRTMKRMSKLTPKVKELQEKYKDDPTTQNQEVMKLYREYQINPLGGCLPMFVQLPIFLGYYRMLQSAVELRHEHFLWVKDLAMPDTLFTIPFLGDFPVNPLPILMGISMVLQMRLTPQSGDKTQRMIFMMMPIVFLIFCYNFAAALSLYWTTSNIFSIGQTLLMNRLPEPELKKKKNVGGSGGKGFLARLQEQAEEQQKRNKIAGEKGSRSTQSRSQKRKKR